MRFKLRREFQVAQIRDLAARSTISSKVAGLAEIGERARTAGYYSKEDFSILCRETHASKICRRNSADAVVWFTGISLSSDSEQERIESLMRLSGVSWVTASVLLHFAFENQYPVVSWETIWLWLPEYCGKPSIDFGFWLEYMRCSQKLCSVSGVSMRQLHLAMWQFTAEKTARSPMPLRNQGIRMNRDQKLVKE